jgi:transcriptional regulator with XRE-family HTH domain
MRATKTERVMRGVGRRVAELRLTAELTQERLAEKCKVSLKYLQRVEAGRENLTLESLVKLANVLKVAPSALLEPPSTLARPRLGRPAKR